MLTTIVFDLDGTLLNTIEDIRDSLNIALEKFGFESCTIDQAKEYLGSGVKMLVHRALRPFEHTESDEVNVFQIYTQEYEEHKTNKTNTYFGITELLSELKSRGVKIAVLSNKYHDDVVELMNRYFGENTFDIIHGKMHGVPVKPDPTGLVDIMHELHSHAEEVLVVGDSEVDMELASNTGVKKCAVTWGYRPYEVLSTYAPDYIVNEPKEILNIVNELRPEIIEEEEAPKVDDFDDASQASNVQTED